MHERAFQRAVTMDEAGVLEDLVRLLESVSAPYCVIGGQGVNAYVEPLVSLDLDVVIAAVALDRVLAALPKHARIERFAHSVNVALPGSAVRVQFQTDERYAAFPSRATAKPVLGLTMRVAAVEDLLDGKVWAALDPGRRASKRQKDLADIARLIDRYPHLESRVPAAIRDKLI
jgi:hypothetical protein